MRENKNNTLYKKSLLSLTYAAMLIAIGVILGFLKLPLNPFVELRFQQIPIAISGFLLGPFYGGAVGALTDILSYFVHPTGEFFPGFTLSSALTGVIFAVFIPRKQFPAECLIEPFLVDFLDSLHDLEQSGASGNTIGFQRGRDRKTDRFLGAGFVCNDEICCQSVKMPVNALDRGVK